jgi:hypothetical protein
VLESATVEQAMAAVIKQYQSESRQPPLEHPVPEAFLMRVTEDDGEIDTDVPALDRSRPVSKFAFSDGFALVPDPAYEPPAPTRTALAPHLLTCVLVLFWLGIFFWFCFVCYCLSRLSISS